MKNRNGAAKSVHGIPSHDACSDLTTSRMCGHIRGHAYSIFVIQLRESATATGRVNYSYWAATTQFSLSMPHVETSLGCNNESLIFQSILNRAGMETSYEASYKATQKLTERR